MGELLEVHDSCGMRKGSPSAFTGVMLLLNEVSDDYYVHETVLQAVANEIPSNALCSIIPDFENNIYKLYIHGVEFVCEILRKGVLIEGKRLMVYPLFAYFTISNVHPSIQNAFLIDMFSEFGSVMKIEHVYACPNSAKFGHVLTDKRRIVFQLSPDNRNSFLPKTLRAVVDDMLLNLEIEPYCSACTTSGHEIMDCPENMQDMDSSTLVCTRKKYSESDDQSNHRSRRIMAVNDGPNWILYRDRREKSMRDAQFSFSSASSESDENQNEGGSTSKLKVKKQIKPYKIKRELLSSPEVRTKFRKIEGNQDGGSLNVYSGCAVVAFESIETFNPEILSVKGSVKDTESGDLHNVPVVKFCAEKLSNQSVSGGVEENDTLSGIEPATSIHSNDNCGNSESNGALLSKALVEKDQTSIPCSDDENIDNRKEIRPERKKASYIQKYSKRVSSGFTGSSGSDSSLPPLEPIATFSSKRKRGRPRKYVLW